MVIVVAIIFVVYTLVVFTLVVGVKRLPMLGKQKEHYKYTVIIPFHNEVDRIDSLINSLNQSDDTQDCQILFIDDHSTDGTSAKIEENLLYPFAIIKNEVKKGKKHSIRIGVTAAKHNCILTLDADISFQPNFLNSIGKILPKGMVVLPVQTYSKGLIGRMADIEFSFLQVITFGSLGWSKPLLCNGANLIFNKSDFLTLDKERTDYNIASGDDMFLMNQFKSANKSISGSYDLTTTVYTANPQRFIPLLKQRRRWLGKMKNLLSFDLFLGGSFLIILQFVFIFSFLNVFTDSLFYWLIVLKILTDLFLLFIGRNLSVNGLLLIVLFQFWYPFYLIAILYPLNREKRWMS